MYPFSLKGNVVVPITDISDVSYFKRNIKSFLEKQGFEVIEYDNDIKFKFKKLFIFNMDIKNYFLSRTTKGIYSIKIIENKCIIEFKINTTLLLFLSIFASGFISIFLLQAENITYYGVLYKFISLFLFFSFPNYLILWYVNRKFLRSSGDRKLY